MRAKLLLLLCVVSLPNLLPAQLGIEEALFTSAISNRPDPQKRLDGEIAEAESALTRIEKSAGSQSSAAANAASGLADLYLKAGDYERASPLIERALEIRRKNPGDKDLDRSASLHQLAEFREELGEFTEAQKLYKEALAVRELSDPNSIETAATLHALGRLLSKTDNLAEAEGILRKALVIRQQKLPAKDVATAYTLYELAKVEARRGNASEAAQQAKDAREIFETVLGDKHPDTEDARLIMEALGDRLNEAAVAIGMQVDDIWKTKDPSARRQLFLSGPFNAQEALRLSDDAELLEAGDAQDREQALLMQERSLRIRQRVLGPEHPQTLQSLQRLGLAALDQRQYDKALVFARKAMFAQTRHLQRVFSFSDERQRLAFEATVRPYSVFASLPEVPASDLATAALRFKGAVLDSLLAERRQADASHDPSLRPLLVRSAGVREAWRRLEADAIVAESKDLPVIDARRASLEKEFQEIEEDFAQAGLGTGGLAGSTSPRQIASALPPDALLVELIHYSHQLEGTRIEERYGALLLAAAGDPVWVPLGPAADLEKLVDSYKESAQGKTDKNTLQIDLRELYDRLWLPIERVLPRPYRRVIISPDGSLNFVSFATLLDADGRFLAEKVAISYVASGRDLLREVPPAIDRQAAIVFANPDFHRPESPSPAKVEGEILNTASTTAASGSFGGVQKRDIEDLHFNALPGTQQECERLSELFTGWHWRTEAFTGPKASKAALRRVRSPQVLHLATHGYFQRSIFFQNPMQRSGLILAGGQSTLDAWSRGHAPPVDNDGIVTAGDVAALDLRGTWLVTLSACETGSGEAQAGEGVLGLRRGFLQAGAQNLLMTLWSIDDGVTVQIIGDFYAAAHQGGNAAQALADVQREWLIALRDGKGEKFDKVRAVLNGRGVAVAVRLAGPFILSAQGKP
jgi:CHAT domain-containing protein/Tfp pilus assembly protein PilF